MYHVRSEWYCLSSDVPASVSGLIAAEESSRRGTTEEHHMARPRVFISSTYYDLRQVREDIERMVRELGYEPIRHETGRIPYSKDDKLETAAYREVELSDIIVSIVGGRFGSESAEQPGLSISQAELRRALEHGIQVFIFVEKNTLSEYSTYQLNKDAEDVKYRFADDIRVYEFIEQLYALPQNNPIQGFETSANITEFLRLQWAGLFQRFLQDQQRLREMRVLEEMNASAKTLRDLVTYLTEERKGTNVAINEILVMNHPAFRSFAKAVDASYRVFFTTRDELDQWLRGRAWTTSDPKTWDADSIREWHTRSLSDGYLKLSKNIFDTDGRLIAMTADEWDDSWVGIGAFEASSESADDDIPF
jgi:hypothetical protein